MLKEIALFIVSFALGFVVCAVIVSSTTPINAKTTECIAITALNQSKDFCNE